MNNINATGFRKNLFELLEQTIKYNEPVNITTKNGNAVLISEEDYRNILETLYISSIPKLKESILRGLKEPKEDLIPLGDKRLEDLLNV